MRLVNLKIVVNLYSSVVYTNDGKIQSLSKAHDNSRSARSRPETSLKKFEMSLIPMSNDKDGFATEISNYGIKWAEDFKLDPNACPSFNEMIE